MTAPPTSPQPRYQPRHGGQPDSSPPPTRRSRRKWPWVVLGVLVLFIIIGVANSPSPPSSTTGLVPTPEQTVQAADPPAPQSVAPQPVAPGEAADPPAPPPVAPPPNNDDSSGGAVYYKNCDAARAAGAAPINRGEPSYRPALDRDNDGVACE